MAATLMLCTSRKMRASCTHVAGPLASDVLEADRAGGTSAILSSGAYHPLGLIAKVVGRNWVRWSVAQLSNESAFPSTTDLTP